ncbi:MAG: hypothetical protein K6A05_02325 [Lachnospiraceae bacterium]|nr:hypothetical protein [Lachnospiraceae bacterium]
MSPITAKVMEPDGYNGKIVVVTTDFPTTKCQKLTYEFQSFGAGIRKISVIDKDNQEHTLTLTYTDVAESCSNTSLAGLTIGPNAGRLPGNTTLELCDQDAILRCTPEANEGTNQLHGGPHHLATKHWDLVDIIEGVDDCDVVFATRQPLGLDGWPGNRSYQVHYHINAKGLAIHLEGSSDARTYINMTNHTYWMRDGLELGVHAKEYVVNEANFLPREIAALSDVDEAGFFTIKKGAVYNNAFLLDSMNCAASLRWPDLDFGIRVETDAPALVVYTGDYLDDATMVNGRSSTPGCAVALEVQELWPMTGIHLTTPNRSFHREIRYRIIT